MTGKLEIFPYELPKTDLDAMPSEQRSLLILLCHASNEINVLQKLLIMSTKGTSTEQFVDHVEAAQGMIIFRVLVGKLHECWQLLQTRVFKAPVARTYVEKLDREGSEALASLKQHFSRDSLISNLRNKVCFHYPGNEDVAKAFQSLPDEEFVFYLAQHQANSFYLGPETVVNRLLQPDKVEGDGGASGLKPLFEAVILMAKEFVVLFGKLIVLLCEERMSMAQVEAAILEVGELPALPFFVDPASLRIS